MDNNNNNFFKDNISKWAGVPLRKISGSLLSDLLEPEVGFSLVTLCRKTKLSALAKGVLGEDKAGVLVLLWDEERACERERWGLCQ